MDDTPYRGSGSSINSGCDACATEQSIIFISRNVRQASYAPRKHSKAGIVTGNFASKPPGRIVTFAPGKASVSYARSPIRALTGQLNQKKGPHFLARPDCASPAS